MTQEKQNNTFNTALALGVILFFFTITGFIFILATRLFKNVTKLPSITGCLWVGVAIWWIAIPFIQPPKNSQPSNGIIGPGYDYAITENTVKLVNPPKADRIIKAYYSDFDNRHIKLYLHGNVDGSNQTYQLSTNKDIIIAPMTNDNINLEADDWVRERPRTLIRKYYETHDFWINKLVITLIIVGLGIWYYIYEQVMALAPTENI